MRCAVLLALLLAAPVLAGPPTELADGRSGLLVPRFVSLKKDRVYARSGPGDDYPVTAVYVRKGLPVEVLKEYTIWRQVRDIDGGTAWVNKTMITGTRTGIVTRAVRVMYSRADLASNPVWRIAPGAVVDLVLCEGEWCRVTRDGKGGYMLRGQLWGTYPGEGVAG